MFRSTGHFRGKRPDRHRGHGADWHRRCRVQICTIHEHSPYAASKCLFLIVCLPLCPDLRPCPFLNLSVFLSNTTVRSAPLQSTPLPPERVLSGPRVGPDPICRVRASRRASAAVAMAGPGTAVRLHSGRGAGGGAERKSLRSPPFSPRATPSARAARARARAHRRTAERAHPRTPTHTYARALAHARLSAHARAGARLRSMSRTGILEGMEAEGRTNRCETATVAHWLERTSHFRHTRTRAAGEAECLPDRKEEILRVGSIG